MLLENDRSSIHVLRNNSVNPLPVIQPDLPRSHALCGNATPDAPRPVRDAERRRFGGAPPPRGTSSNSAGGNDPTHRHLDQNSLRSPTVEFAVKTCSQGPKSSLPSVIATTTSRPMIWRLAQFRRRRCLRRCGCDGNARARDQTGLGLRATCRSPEQAQFVVVDEHAGRDVHRVTHTCFGSPRLTTTTATPNTRRKRRPKNQIPKELRPIYQDVLLKVRELRHQGLSHREVCETLNNLGFQTRTGLEWQHESQIIKLLRSFPEE